MIRYDEKTLAQKSMAGGDFVSKTGAGNKISDTSLPSVLRLCEQRVIYSCVAETFGRRTSYM